MRISVIYKCGRGPQATREPRLDTRDVKESIQRSVLSFTSRTSTCSSYFYYVRRATASRRSPFPALALYVTSEHLILTAKHLNKTRGPRKTANWNSGDCNGACSHAKRSEWSDASCQLKQYACMYCHTPASAAPWRIVVLKCSQVMTVQALYGTRSFVIVFTMASKHEPCRFISHSPIPLLTGHM